MMSIVFRIFILKKLNCLLDYGFSTATAKQPEIIEVAWQCSDTAKVFFYISLHLRHTVPQGFIKGGQRFCNIHKVASKDFFSLFIFTIEYCKENKDINSSR